MIESWMQASGLALPAVIRGLGHRYVLVTRDPALYADGADGGPHPVVRDADEIVVVDTNDLDAVRRVAAEVTRRSRIDGVLTTCDYYLETVATVAHDLALAGASPEVMRRATRKDEVRLALDLAGLPNPGFAAVRSWQSARAAAVELGYPLVAKPVDLNAGTSVRRVDDEAGLKDAYWAITGAGRNTRGQPLSSSVLLEELLLGPEYSVEAVTHDGLTQVLAVTEKTVTGGPVFVEIGHQVPARLDPGFEREVRRSVELALAAIGLRHGLSHTEVKLTAGGPRIVEINPRQGGGYIFDLVDLVTGVNPLAVLVELALGRRPVAPAPALESARERVGSAAVAFVVTPEGGVLTQINGLDGLAEREGVLHWSVDPPLDVSVAADNNARFGHVIAVDREGQQARARAEAAVASLRLEMADGRSLAPLVGGRVRDRR